MPRHKIDLHVNVFLHHALLHQVWSVYPSTLFQTELSQSLQSLSEKAKTGTEFIQGLKAMTDKVHVSIVRLCVSEKA